MAEKEPRDAEPKSDPPDQVTAKRQQFASWVQSVQHKARPAGGSMPVAAAPPLGSHLDTGTQPIASNAVTSRSDGSNPAAASAPIPRSNPVSSSNPLSSPQPVSSSRPVASSSAASSRPPPPSSRATLPGTSSSRPPESGRKTAPTPIAAWDPGTFAYRDELPPDELTAVFAPPPELLARSGRHPTPATGWEEPTQVVSVDGDVLERLAASRSHPPSPAAGAIADGAAKASPVPASRPTPEPIDLEQRLDSLATPLPPTRRGRWLLWALFIVLVGAGTAAAIEYTLHPGSTLH